MNETEQQDLARILKHLDVRAKISGIDEDKETPIFLRNLAAQIATKDKEISRLKENESLSGHCEEINFDAWVALTKENALLSADQKAAADCIAQFKPFLGENATPVTALIEMHKAAVQIIEAKAVENAALVKGRDAANQWKFCPECGSDKFQVLTHYTSNDKEPTYPKGTREMGCVLCTQIWFTDMDYTDTIRTSLSERKRLKQRSERLQEALELFVHLFWGRKCNAEHMNTQEFMDAHLKAYDQAKAALEGK